MQQIGKYSVGFGSMSYKLYYDEKTSQYMLVNGARKFESIKECGFDAVINWASRTIDQHKALLALK